MSTFIKTGYWEKLQKGYKNWLNLDDLIKEVASTVIPPSELTSDEVEAIQNANTPTASNPFATSIEVSTITNNPETGTTYTLALTDEYVTCTNANPIIVTIPLNATVAFPIGWVVTIEQGGAGQITIAPEGAVVINSLDSGTKTGGQYACVQLVKKAIDIWTLIGATT